MTTQGTTRRQLRERTTQSALCTCADCGHRIVRASMAAALRELDQHLLFAHDSALAAKRLTSGNR